MSEEKTTALQMRIIELEAENELLRAHIDQIVESIKMNFPVGRGLDGTFLVPIERYNKLAAVINAPFEDGRAK